MKLFWVRHCWQVTIELFGSVCVWSGGGNQVTYFAESVRTHSNKHVVLTKTDTIADMLQDTIYQGKDVLCVAEHGLTCTGVKSPASDLSCRAQIAWYNVRNFLGKRFISCSSKNSKLYIQLIRHGKTIQHDPPPLKLLIQDTDRRQVYWTWNSQNTDVWHTFGDRKRLILFWSSEFYVCGTVISVKPSSD